MHPGIDDSIRSLNEKFTVIRIVIYTTCKILVATFVTSNIFGISYGENVIPSWSLPV